MRRSFEEYQTRVKQLVTIEKERPLTLDELLLYSAAVAGMVGWCRHNQLPTVYERLLDDDQ